MARYLLTIRSSEDLPAAAAPADYLVDTGLDSAPSAGGGDGLAHWSVDLQLMTSARAWAAAPAYDEFWTYLRQLAAAQELRPRVTVRIRSKVDAHSVSATIGYLGDNEARRAADGIRKRLAGDDKANLSLVF